MKILKQTLVLKNSLKNGKSKHVINKGLWSSKGIRKLYVLNKRPQSSSMYEPDKKSLTIYGFKEKDFHLFDVEKTEMVECDTLSSSLKELNINTLDYLKIDTQGSELDILKGSLDLLETITGIEVEVEFAELYKNQPLFEEVHTFLKENKFELFDLKRYYWKRS